VIFAFESHLDILLLFLTHKVLTLHTSIIYLLEFYMLCLTELWSLPKTAQGLNTYNNNNNVAMLLLYNYWTLPHPLSFGLYTLCHISVHCDMISFSHILELSSQMTFLSSFPPSLINLAGIWSCPVSFLFSNLLVVIPVSTSFRRSRYGSAVCRHIHHCPCPCHLAVQSVSYNI